MFNNATTFEQYLITRNPSPKILVQNLDENKKMKGKQSYHLALLQIIIGNLFFLILLPFSTIAQNQNVEEIKYQQQFDSVFESNQADTAKFKFILDSIDNLNPIYSDLPISFIKKSIALAEKKNNLFWTGEMYHKLGQLNYKINKLDNSILAYRKSIESFSKINNLSKVGKIKGRLVLIYAMTDRSDQALQEAYEALEILEKLKDEIGIAWIYETLAYNFLNTGKFNQALEYSKKSVEIFQRHKRYKSINAPIYYLTESYIGLKNYEKAIETIDQSIQMMMMRPNYAVHSLSRKYLLKAKIFEELKQYNQALTALDQALEILSDGETIPWDERIMTDKGRILHLLKQYNASNEILYKMTTHPKKETNRYLYQVVSTISLNYAKLNQYDSAYHYKLEEEILIQDKRFHESKLKMEELKTQYETEQKEATIASQEKQLSQQKLIQSLGFGFVGVLGLLLFQAYRNTQTKKRHNEALKNTNVLLENKNKENEILLKEIHHRVKNNLQTISSLLNLQSNTIIDQNALDAVQESRNRVASMAMIHQKLYQGENLATIEMRDYFETIGSAIIDSFGEKAAQVELNIDMSEIELDVDTAIPIGLITNELITNSLKYAFPETGIGKISISLKKEQNNIIYLKISDNGTPETTSNINNQGTGFGSLLVQLLTTQLGGQVEKTTTDGTATIIQFSLKKEKAA